MIKKILTVLFILSITISIKDIHAGNLSYGINPEEEKEINGEDSLKWSINFLSKILNSGGEWYLTDQSNKRPIKGILDYAKNDPVDTLIVEMKSLLSDQKLIYLFDRRPQDIRDFQNVKGYISEEKAQQRIESLKKKISDSLSTVNIPVPRYLIENEASKAPVIPQEDPRILINERENELPLDFKSKLYESFNTINRRTDLSPFSADSLKIQTFITFQKSYNDSIVNLWRSIAIVNYRNQYISDFATAKVNVELNKIKRSNLKLLTEYNDIVVNQVNDSLKYALSYLTKHAENDSLLIRLYNITDNKSDLWTANRDINPIRMYLKNPQNDSISVILINNGKGSVKLIIDDGVILTRLRETQKKEVTFQTQEPDRRLKKIVIEKPKALPWTLIGYGTVGFTQTALSNWSKGGESSLAMLVIGKYKANYSKDKVRWENGAEMRYGITQTKSKGFQKNDDKLEFQSRFGYSAFKKWFYSGEANFRTQMAPGYKFPNMKDPISGFMSPGYLTFSIGLDYKPNPNFSLFLSPLSSKTTFVKDTANINPVNFGLEPGTKSLWEPGLIVKTLFKKKLAENINYETKGEFFNNYRYPFKKFAFDWEQTLTMRVNHYINVMIMSELIYDYNVKFPILDADGKVIDRKPKWQFKELFTIGFNYKF